MLKMLSTLLYVLVGIVNLLPLSGVLSANRLGILYGVSLTDPNLTILMRHRAMLFGIVGCLLIASAFHVALRPTAVTAGLVSMLSFVAIAYLVGDFNAELRRIIVIDLIASLMLVAACALPFLSRSEPIAP